MSPSKQEVAKLYKKYQVTIRQYAKKATAANSLDYEDAVSLCSIFFMNAVIKFYAKKEKPCSFNTFLSRRLQWDLVDFKRQYAQKNKSRVAVTYHDNNISASTIDDLLVREFYIDLPNDLKLVFFLRWCGYSHKQIAKKLNTTISHVRQKRRRIIEFYDGQK
jgi:RNA polymerase sigma factor (sigma-70 family)